MQWNLRASRETGQARRDVLGADLLRAEGNGLYAVAALDYRQRIDSQNVCFCHGKYLLMKNAVLFVNLTAALSVRQGRQSTRLAVMRNAKPPATIGGEKMAFYKIAEMQKNRATANPRQFVQSAVGEFMKAGIVTKPDEEGPPLHMHPNEEQITLVLEGGASLRAW